jgi:hypothetical protein
MLADQRLGQAQRRHEFVDAVLPLEQLQHEGDAHRGGQRPQQFSGAIQIVGADRGRTIGNHFH